jgi:putative hydrolase of the HAD superfamily
VLFDLDDTLFDHRHCTRTALAALRAGRAGLEAWPLEELERRHSRILEELHLQVIGGALPLDRAREERFRRLFEEAGVDADPEEVAACALRYKADYISARRAVAGAHALLDLLRPEVALGVVTNNLQREQEEKLHDCGLAGYMDVVVISEAVGVAKPDPRIFQIALDRAGSTPGEAVVVGDAWGTDILGALRAGIRAIWINWDGVPVPDPAAPVEIVSGLQPVDALATVILGRAPALAGTRP